MTRVENSSPPHGITPPKLPGLTPACHPRLFKSFCAIFGAHHMPFATSLPNQFLSVVNRLSLQIDAWIHKVNVTTAKIRVVSARSDSLSDYMRAYDARGERAIAIAQAGIALFILALHLGARIGKDLSVVNFWIVCALLALIGSSAIRGYLSRLAQMPERWLNALNVSDVMIFLTLIWSYQFAYDHAAGGVLKAPSLVTLFVLVSLRALRFHPGPLLLTGAAAVAGWITLVCLAVFRDGSAEITHDYVAYLYTSKILIGAEVEKLTALISMILFLAFATHKARAGLLQLDDMLEHMPQGVAMFDPDQNLVVCNGLYAEVYGLSRNDLKPGQSIEQILNYRLEKGVYEDEPSDNSSTTEWVSEFANATNKTRRLADGRILSIRRQRKPDGGIISTTTDITDLNRLEARIEHLAYHDSLTGLANRVALSERLDRILEDKGRSGNVSALCIDLDHFKDVNDTLGHPVGDALLQAVAGRLRSAVKDEDLVSRTGGDEFVVVLTSATSAAATASVAARIVDAVSAPYKLLGHQVIIGVSVGISLSVPNRTRSEDLIKEADMALYCAKEEGRGMFRFFEAGMIARRQTRRALEQDLRKALEGDEFELYYQPVINVEQNQIQCLEALIRWHHPERGLISPGDFIPLMEEIGLASSVGEWVIRQACSDATRWSSEIKIAVNVSAAQFRKPGLIDTVKDALADTGLDGRRLELEITETALLEGNDATIAVLTELRSLGVRVAMDDFGTGYASLSYLHKFPFDRIKIDRSFIDGLTKDGNAQEIVRCVISLSNGLGMETTAEGIETSEQLACVKALGCSDIQGYLISKPCPRNEIEHRFFPTTNVVDWSQPIK